MGSRSMMAVAPLLAAAVLTLPGPVAAQQVTPECDHLNYRGNFRLNGAQQHLDQATRTTFADTRQGQLNDAGRLLADAARMGGVDQPTLWYLFGQYYLLKHDLVGADSAFTKAEAGTDANCRADIQRRRRNEWVPLQNAGVEQMNAGNADSALALFRTSNVIYRGEPYAFLNMATIFVNKGMSDSAIAYYRTAASSTTNPRYEDARATALFNAARLLHRAAEDTAGIHAEAARRSVSDSVVRVERLDSALAAYQTVLQIKPRDLQAQASLAGVLSQLHRVAESRAVYDSMLAHADSMDALDLFDAGVALFREQRYDLAARAIELGLGKNRCYRDALYNLANVYLAAKDSVHLLDAARRLVAVDSMSRSSLQLLAAAYQRNGDQQGTLRELMKRDSLPWEVQFMRFDPGDSTASITGVVSNLQAKQLTGFRLTIQFVDGACGVVGEQNVDIPDLNPAGQPGSSYDFRGLEGKGRGIVAFKYKVQ